MRLWKIIVTATVVEAACVAAAAAILGLSGAWSGWLDMLNQFAPLWFAVCVVTAPGVAILLEDGSSRRALTGLAIAGAVASGWSVLPELAAALPRLGQGTAAAPPLKIVTFNTWSENPTPQAVTAAVMKAGPDAVALIEMSWPLAHDGLKALRAAYPYRTVPRHGCPWDIQLFSRRPFAAYGCRITESARRPGVTEGIVWGRTTAPDGRPFTLATTHYAWPFPGGGQAMQRPALARWVRAQGGADLILTGDFNLTPWSVALKRQDRALRPLTRRDHAIFTWPAMIARLDRPAPFAILPIDHVYAGPAWRTLSVRRLARAGSDHYGIEAEFTR